MVVIKKRGQAACLPVRQGSIACPLFSGFLAMTAFVPSAFACPLCKEALAKMGSVWTAIGFNLSIYMMIAVPFLLVAFFGGAIYLNYRKHRPL